MADVARADRLVALRKKQRWSQETAAHMIGVSVKTLRSWEKGGNIKWSNARRAGEVYEVDPESLVTREEGDDESLAVLFSPDVDELREAVSALGGKMDQVLERIAALATVVENQGVQLDQQEKMLRAGQRGQAKGK